MAEYNHKRVGKRITKPHLIRFKQIEPVPEVDEWEVATSTNISVTGICFNSQKRYSVGATLTMKVSNPLMHMESGYVGVVVRSESSRKLANFYETAVKIEIEGEEERAAFYKEIEMWLAKEGES
ncbi:MAG: hypothetical protein KKD07_06180 [Candidatus Omnitrophica bacterium]|nr:hypothetical protein [Candidatus Omnitrophota bacterium]MBU1995671.1 hypothetical protein [Candidatus Omnitrophota bacterium]MBU4334011.1 hypothetical protein [Candidatus Omnitrophota bacterium]